MRKDPEGEAMRWLTYAEEEFKDASDLMRGERFYKSNKIFTSISSRAYISCLLPV
jgi:hypothetical protein